MDNTEIQKYYDENPQYEWDRLTLNPYEFDINMHYMERYICPGQTVLDIGGGPGRYSIALCKRGCPTTLCDLSPENVRFARERASEQGIELEAYSGDVLRLDELSLGMYDHVLLMGPLYHLTEDADRRRAVEQAVTHLNPGGTIFVSFISSLAGMLYELREAPALVLEPSEAEGIRCFVEDQPYVGQAFTTARFDRIPDIVPEMESYGLQTLHLLGSESILAPFRANVVAQPPEVYAKLLEIALQVCERPDLLNWAEHPMYVGRKPI